MSLFRRALSFGGKNGESLVPALCGVRATLNSAAPWLLSDEERPPSSKLTTLLLLLADSSSFATHVNVVGSNNGDAMSDAERALLHRAQFGRMMPRSMALELSRHMHCFFNFTNRTPPSLSCRFSSAREHALEGHPLRRSSRY